MWRKLFKKFCYKPRTEVIKDEIEPTQPVVEPEVIEEVQLPKLNFDGIQKIDFPRNQYYEKQHEKKQIYLHHTVSGKGVKNDFNYWAKSKARIATCVIIGHDGVIHQGFSSKFWAHHLGIKSKHFTKFELPNINTTLNQRSIGIEIDSYGGLVKENGVWKNVYGGVIDDVVEYPEGYRGYYAYERYTDAQIESVRQLLVYWGEFYGINIKYQGDDMWDVNKDALEGKEGVWSHTSVRPDKSDVHPCPNLVKMLKSL